jgi:hypothetical protein
MARKLDDLLNLIEILEILMGNLIPISWQFSAQIKGLD